MSQGDREAVAGLLGRAPQGAFEVVVRDAAGGPVVILNAPLLDDGTPMPTRYWLVGRAERESVSRLESTGGVRAAEAAVDAAELEAAHARYEALRDAAVPAGHRGPRPTGGVGGTRRGVKCLHAHLAWYLAGGPDPVGRWTCDKLGIDAPLYRVESAAGGARAAGDGRPRGPVAAIDCGTNSTRLLVVDASGRPLERLMRITRLGQGVDRTGRLAEAAMQRTIDVLAEFREVMDRPRRGAERGRRRPRRPATPSNAAEFAQPRDARSSASRPRCSTARRRGGSPTSGRPPSSIPPQGRYLVIDVGGGSTELVRRPAGRGGPGRSRSCRSRWAACAAPSASSATTRRSRASSQPPGRTCAGSWPGPSRNIPASRAPPADRRRRDGGALVRLDQGLVVYDRNRIHHARLSLATVERLLGELAARAGGDPARDGRRSSPSGRT